MDMSDMFMAIFLVLSAIKRFH